LVYLNEHFTERLKSMELNRKRNVFVQINRLSILIIISTTILYGCKVSYSFSGASISPQVKTFSVQYFQNRAALVQPGLSQYLTDELINKCKSQTRLKYNTGLGDVSFEGVIKDYKTLPTTVAADAQAAMNRFTITVTVKFTNSVQPEYNFEKDFSRYEDYTSNTDLSSVEKELSDKIIAMIVEDVFNQAFVNW
jgi:hypothetical protein